MERKPKTDQDLDTNKDRPGSDHDTEALMEPQMEERRSQLSKRAERHSKEARLQMLTEVRARGSWFPCSAHNEAVVSIDPGIDQTGGHWRGCCWCFPGGGAQPSFQPCPIPPPPTLPFIRFSFFLFFDAFFFLIFFICSEFCHTLK